MKFKNLHVVNFQSLGDVTFPFPSGLVLIDGIDEDLGSANGVGKSALMSSITYALYGRTPKNIKSENLIRNGMKSMSVELEFEGNDNAIIQVKRTRTESSSKLFLTINGVKVDGTIKDLEKRIPALVGLEFDQFVQTVYVFQGSNRRFISLNDTEKKGFLSTLLNLDSYDAAYKLAHSQLTVAEIDLSRHSGSIDSIKQNLLLLNGQLDTATTTLKFFQAQKEAQSAEFTKQVVAIQSEVLTLNDKIRDLSKESTLAVQQLESKKFDVETRIQKGRKIEDSIRKVAQEIKNVDNDIKHAIAQKDGHAAGICPECDQTLPNFDPAAYDAECDKKIATLTTKRNTLIAMHLAYDAELPDFDSLSHEYTQVVTDIAKEKAKGPEKYQMEISLKNSELKNISNSLNSANEKERMLQGQIESLQKSIVSAQENLSKVEAQSAGLVEKKVYLLESKKLFSPTGVRAYVFDAILKDLNARIEYYLDVLTGGVIKFSFESDEIKGKFTESCEYSGINRDLDSLSGGEHRRLSLAVDLALADVVSSRASIVPNVLFLDEAADGLDVAGKEALMNLMGLLADKKEAVYIIDHSSEFKTSFSRVFRLVKRNQETSVG